MKFSFFFVLLFVHNSLNYGPNDKVDEEEKARKLLLDQLTKTRTVLIDDYELVTRQVATDVYMYRSYRTVSVIFYPVTRDVVDARFLFQAEELHLNKIGSCKPQTIIINLKYAAYPAVNPDGYKFPKDFIDPDDREPIHTIELLSDGVNKTFSLQNPKAGNWYGLVYVKWEDPRTQSIDQQDFIDPDDRNPMHTIELLSDEMNKTFSLRNPKPGNWYGPVYVKWEDTRTQSIDQQGLVAICQTLLYTDLQIKKEETIQLIDCYSGLKLDYKAIRYPSIYKCISHDNNDAIHLNITIENTPANVSKIAFKVEALSLPTSTNYLVSCLFDPQGVNSTVVTFYPNPNAWHYISISTISDNITNIADCESYYFRTDLEDLDGYTVTDLMRDGKGRFFSFEYGLPTTDLQEATSLINLTSNTATSVRFNINQFLDIGGTVTIEASLLMSMKYYMGYLRRFKQETLLAFTNENPFFRVVICLDLEHTSVPLDTGRCKYNDNIKPALFVLNSTDSDSIYEKVIIPFPESGTWYLTFRLFCDNVVCPCNTTENGTKYYVDMNGEDKDDNATESSNGVRVGDSECNATVVLSLASSSCVNARCSNHGSCMLNTFGGLVMSFCSCNSGYGGWDCSDDSRMDSSAAMLTAILLLTLSNLLFFFSVYVAIIRLYYSEAIMYFFTMVFSTFYHACDAPAQIAYCIVRGQVLQFGDFYCGLMSFWVTLLAMSLIDDRLKSTLQLVGALAVALLTTWNMHSFYSFLIPVMVGVSVVFLSWYLDYRMNHKITYPRSYYTRYLPAGILLVSFGLICYAFLQTEQNYKIVHSIWHMIIAVSVVFLLPDVKRGDEVSPFLPGRNYLGVLFHRSPSPETVSQTD